jgi:hypothetical protein
MNEEQVGRRVAWHLDRGLDQLDQGTLNALAAARHAALARRPAYEPDLAPAGQSKGRTVSSGHRRGWGRWWVPASAVAIALAALLYMQTMNQQSILNPNHELGAIDAGLLADDLPIGAYLDKGFDTWLDDTSD